MQPGSSRVLINFENHFASPKSFKVCLVNSRIKSSAAMAKHGLLRSLSSRLRLTADPALARQLTAATCRFQHSAAHAGSSTQQQQQQTISVDPFTSAMQSKIEKELMDQMLRQAEEQEKAEDAAEQVCNKSAKLLQHNFFWVATRNIPARLFVPFQFCSRELLHRHGLMREGSTGAQKVKNLHDLVNRSFLSNTTALMAGDTHVVSLRLSPF